MGSFNVDFDILSYDKKNFLPSLDEYLKKDEIINYREFEKGNVDNCFWQKTTPTLKEIQSESFRELEVKRIIKTGAWIAVKDTVLWLPPNYYFALKYGAAGARPMQFRLKRLKHVYHKLEARSNPACKGTLTIKNRGDGETTMAITDAFWECLDGNAEIGQMGIQSKTRNDCINPCWMYVQVLWQTLPHWLKNELCSDFASGNNIAEKMKWMRDADEERGISARNVLFAFYPSGTSMDGKHDVLKCILDEICKWEECSFFDVYTNYGKFIMPGIERRGMFDMFSSPADKQCNSNDEVKILWDLSDMDKINPETGTTQSRIHRIYSNPLDGIPGFYDKFGDVDRDKIYAHIMRERAAMPPEKLLGEIRGYPLTEDEMWGSADAEKMWSNTEGIKKRQIYLVGKRFKNDVTKEPKVVFGNLEWIDGHIDSDVAFRQADVADFDITKARFCFSYLPDEENKGELKRTHEGKPIPPKYVENCLGIDPFNLRYATKDKSKASSGAMVNRVFRDIFERGVNRCPSMIYDCRPSHQEVMFEDAIKAAVFNRALIQYENRSDKFANYAEDRGYFDWLLPEIGAKKDSERKGDAPTGKGNFLVEGMGLIDAATNVPLKDGPYDLEMYWFERLLSAYLKFDPKNTQIHNLVMADMQALVGIVKILKKKTRQPSTVNTAVMDFLMN